VLEKPSDGRVLLLLCSLAALSPVGVGWIESAASVGKAPGRSFRFDGGPKDWSGSFGSSDFEPDLAASLVVLAAGEEVWLRLSAELMKLPVSDLLASGLSDPLETSRSWIGVAVGDAASTLVGVSTPAAAPPYLLVGAETFTEELKELLRGAPSRIGRKGDEKTRDSGGGGGSFVRGES